MGPVINAAAVERYRRAIDAARSRGPAALRRPGADARRAGARPLRRADGGQRRATATACGARSCSCRWCWSARSTRWTRPSTRANDSDYGLTAGFYGAPDEIATFLDRIEAGVTYVNRPQGATTGAWPGYQPFGGWKGSGNTGKAIGSFWYLPQYLREQSQTVVD